MNNNLTSNFFNSSQLLQPSKMYSVTSSSLDAVAVDGIRRIVSKNQYSEYSRKEKVKLLKPERYKVNFQMDKAYHGFFKCKRCRNKWSSNNAYFKETQTCSCCNTEVIAFPLAEIKTKTLKH